MTFVFGGQWMLPAALLLGATAWAGPAQAGEERTLYSFCETDCHAGNAPASALIRDAQGNLYGTTQQGGDGGSGGVYELERSGEGYKFRTIHPFCSQQNCRDGHGADERLVIDSAGNLYGTVSEGGAHDGGGVFRIRRSGSSKWKYEILYSFCAGRCEDSLAPIGGLTYQGAANGVPYDGISPLYGTTSGSAHGGTVFELSLPSGGSPAFKTLYTFCGANDCRTGSSPQAPVVLDADGNIYGTTRYGGTSFKGTVFKLSPSDAGYDISTLYSFCREKKCKDGGEPIDGVALDAAGNIYGTTAHGPDLGFGTLFKLVHKNAKSWKYVLAHGFCAEKKCKDGWNPLGGVTIASNGDVLGTTQAGGAHRFGGTLYRLHGNEYTVLYSFNATPQDGYNAYGGVVLDEAGDMFGVTGNGGEGESANGTLYEFVP